MRWPVLIALTALVGVPAQGDGFRKLEGHGGPLMAVAADSAGIATGSFDNAVGLWSTDGDHRAWLDGHAAAVKAVALVGTDRIASAGDDNTVILWDRATGRQLHRLSGHTGKVVAVAASPDGQLIASASWDRRVGIWDAGSGRHIRWLTGHTGNVNAAAFGADGLLYTASYDGTVREWRVADGTSTRILARHGFGVNKLVVNPDRNWLAYGALDGGTRALRLSDGAELADLTLDRRPILAMVQRADGSLVAVGDGEGYIMVVETEGWTVHYDFRAARRGPIWALAFVDGGAAIVAGGLEDAAFIWPLGAEDAPQMAERRRAFHTDPATVGNGERQFLRKCSVCHAVTAGSGRKAGPTLHGIFGRRAGTVAGYAYSPALSGSDLIWNERTIDKLFELGPDHFTPGSKMPMQRIVSKQDRDDLIDFLRRVTAE